jgi:hypothetical protein
MANVNAAQIKAFPEEWHFQPVTTWTPKKHNQKCPDCNNEYYINWTEEQRTYL